MHVFESFSPAAFSFVIAGAMLIATSIAQDRRGVFSSRLWKVTPRREPLLFRRINRIRFLFGWVCACLGAYLLA